MLTFAPAKPAQITSTAIIIDGKRIGHVDAHPENDRGKYRFHACIEMREIEPFSVHNSSLGLAQGHGETAEEAVANAITGSIASARTYIANLERLAHQAGVAL